MTGNENEKHRDKLEEIIVDGTTVFMVTRGTDGGVHGRPMAVAKVDDGFATLWFATSRQAALVDEIGRNAEIFLGGANMTGSEWASVNATAAVVDDRAKIKELWKPMWKNWFEGPDDPNLVLLRVSPTAAEYWDSGSKLLALAKFAFAAATGKQVSDGVHEKVQLAGR